MSKTESNKSDTAKRRTIKSFVLRQGRMSERQQRALDQGWSEYGLSINQGLLNFDNVFARKAPRILEIGFGMGQSLAEMARNHAENDYIGVEVHKPGVGALLADILVDDIHNIRIFHDDVMLVLEQSIPDNSLDGVQLFFPDPWPKTKHHKRRIVNDVFVDKLAKKLKPGGYLHMATDWEDYAIYMMKVMSSRKDFVNQAGEAVYSPRPDYRPQTKFESRGQKLGHGVWDLIFRLSAFK